MLKEMAQDLRFIKVVGSIVSLELDDIFAEEEYNLIYERIQDNNIIMNVTPIIKSNNTESGLIGRYKISLKDFN